MHLRRTIAGLAVALVAAGVSATMAIAAKDTMKVAFPSKFHTMEPYQTSARQMIQMGYLMWDPLVLREPATGKIIPHVATSWKQIDPRTWETSLNSSSMVQPGLPRPSLRGSRSLELGSPPWITNSGTTRWKVVPS